MNDAMHTLIIINAIAILNVHGMAKAHAYLIANGYTTTEALDLFATYEEARDKVHQGMLP